MQPNLARQPQRHHMQQRDYSSPLFFGGLVLVLLWVVMIALLVYFHPFQQVLPQQRSLYFSLVLSLLAWPLLGGATLLLLIGTLLLARPQAIKDIAERGKTPPQERAVYFLCIGVLLGAVSLLFCLGALFSVPPSVALFIFLLVAPCCTAVAPPLTLSYLRRSRRP
jgi:hypothetical protein